MLDQQELKLVLSTLTKRRAWLVKTMDDPNTADDAKAEHLKTLKTLDSALKKLSTKSNKSSAASLAKSIPKAKKLIRDDEVSIEEAHILIAEDNNDSAMLLKGILEDMGCQNIVAVTNGKEAVKAMEMHSPAFDVVLCDWDMPEMDGLQAIKTVRPLEKLRYTHFIMVTAISEAARIKEAVVHGVHDYIVKPIDFDTLEKKISAALQGNALKQAADKKEDEAKEKEDDTPTDGSLLKK